MAGRDEIILATAELLLLREICSKAEPFPVPSDIIEFLHLDSLVLYHLVATTDGGFRPTNLGLTVAQLTPSELMPHGCLFRAADIMRATARTDEP
ncbi:hypothetical protein [Planctomyces sp. SH-PL14]|uniref:hypothetical protein n=1 Tax=Planctomyces sp. SH-PL14 TaxID=1632864 RepID=UPI00078BAB39|nr:hypothetical protein [Planctomyces sp. SH-PL14]AMV21804.1 hypothetical protein VT03_28135 [Planctomyces sp. SH-PL14]